MLIKFEDFYVIASPYFLIYFRNRLIKAKIKSAFRLFASPISIRLPYPIRNSLTPEANQACDWNLYLYFPNWIQKVIIPKQKTHSSWISPGLLSFHRQSENLGFWAHERTNRHVFIATPLTVTVRRGTPTPLTAADDDRSPEEQRR